MVKTGGTGYRSYWKAGMDHEGIHLQRDYGFFLEPFAESGVRMKGFEELGAREVQIF
jgi:hypothetical protein